jgi:predicted peptidase
LTTYENRVHHGDLDDIIPVRASQRMVKALEDANAQNLKFTRYADLMHDSWTAAYNDPEVYRWMLGHKRQVQGDEEGVPAANKVELSNET